MVSALNSGASGPGSSSGRIHCVMFLVKIFNSHSVSLTQEHRWLPDNCFENRTNCGGVTCDVLASPKLPLAFL